MAEKKTKFKEAGKTLSLSELQSIAKAKNKDPLTIMSKALEKGMGLGSRVVNAYNTPGGLGTYRYQGTPSSLDPLKGLSIDKNMIYQGATSYTTPSTRSVNAGYSPGSTTFNPIISIKQPKTTSSSAAALGASPYSDMTISKEGADLAGPGPLAQPNVTTWTPGTTPLDTGDGAGAGAGAGDGTEAGDLTTAIEDYINKLFNEIKQPEMPDFESMISDLTSQFTVNDPLQLAQIGRAYGADAIRARRRARKGRSQYRRDGTGMILGALPSLLRNMAISGGITL